MIFFLYVKVQCFVMELGRCVRKRTHRDSDGQSGFLFNSFSYPSRMRNPQEAGQTQKTTGAQQEMERSEHPWMRQ